MITGPEHEYVYLRRLIAKMDDYYIKKQNKAFGRKRFKSPVAFASKAHFKKAMKKVDAFTHNMDMTEILKLQAGTQSLLAKAVTFS